MSDFDIISENIAVCHKLIKSFACTAEKLDKRSEEMERNISAIIELVADYRHRKQVADSKPGTDLDLHSTDSDTTFHSISTSPPSRDVISPTDCDLNFNDCNIDNIASC